MSENNKFQLKGRKGCRNMRYALYFTDNAFIPTPFTHTEKFGKDLSPIDLKSSREVSRMQIDESQEIMKYICTVDPKDGPSGLSKRRFVSLGPSQFPGKPLFIIKISTRFPVFCIAVHIGQSTVGCRKSTDYRSTLLANGQGPKYTRPKV